MEGRPHSFPGVSLRTRSGLLALAALDQVSISLAQQGIAVLAVAFRAATHVSVSGMSLLMAAVAFGAILGMIPAGLAHDRVGPRLTTSVSGAWAFLALAMLGWLLPETFWALLLLLVFLGVSLPALSLAGLGTVTTLFEGTRHEGLAVGVRQAAAPLGGVAAASLLPWAGHAWPLSRVLLLLAADLGLFTGLLAWALPRRRVAETRARVRLAALLRGIRAPVWVSFLLAPGQYALLTFAVLDLHDKAGRRTVSAGLLLAVALVSGLLARLTLGYLRDRGASVVLLVRATAGLGVAALIAWAVLPRGASLGVLTLLFAALGAGLDGWNALLTTWLTDLSRPAERGLSLGLVGTAGLIGVSIWLPVFGWLERALHSYRPGWVLVAVLYALVAASLARAARHTMVRPPETDST